MTGAGSNSCSISHSFPRSSIFPACTRLREMSQAFSEWRVTRPVSSGEVIIPLCLA
jgi:hypothetical protein